MAWLVRESSSVRAAPQGAQVPVGVVVRHPPQTAPKLNLPAAVLDGVVPFALVEIEPVEDQADLKADAPVVIIVVVQKRASHRQILSLGQACVSVPT